MQAISAKTFPLAALCLAAVAGCGLFQRPVPIADLVAHPENYEGREISVRGRAQGGTQLPFVEIRFYMLTNGQQVVPVVSYDSLPPTDRDVTVSGTFSTVATVGGQGVGPHLTVGHSRR